MRSRANRGFTLVELVVVIAILGILAGVGSVAYSGYVEQTKKGLDIQTVGNIEYAIDTGAYSFAYDLQAPLQMTAGDKSASMKIPVGFIVLSESGVTSVESQTATTSETEACEIVTENFWTLSDRTTYSSVSTLGQKKNGWKTRTFAGSISYCKTHSYVPKVKYQLLSVGTGILKKEMDEDHITNFSVLVGEDDGHRDGQVLDKATGYATPNISSGDSGVMHEMMAAAWGSDYQNTVKLQHTGWNASVSVPTLYSVTDDMLDRINNFAVGVMNYTGGNSAVTVKVLSMEKAILGRDYNSKEEMILSIAEKSSSIDEDGFVSYWKQLDNSRDGKINGSEAEDWGVMTGGATVREEYSALRQAYNSSFASYIRAQSSSGHENCAKWVEEYAGSGTDEIANAMVSAIGDGLYLPKAVHYKAIHEKCITCGELYLQYVSSGASEANAHAVYAMLKTIADNGTDAIAGGDASSGGLVKWYESYAKQLNEMYGALQTVTKANPNCIVISIYSEDGALSYEVTPGEADPRKNS